MVYHPDASKKLEYSSRLTYLFYISKSFKKVIILLSTTLVWLNWIQLGSCSVVPVWISHAIVATWKLRLDSSRALIDILGQQGLLTDFIWFVCPSFL